VLYKYPTYAERTVICCSTQSGCPVGCRFCGAGDYFVRSLTAEEIVAQPKARCSRGTTSTRRDMDRLQIMFMSMGEPLLNLKELDPALRALALMYPKAALLISTSAPRVNYSRAELVGRGADGRVAVLRPRVHRRGARPADPVQGEADALRDRR
jgi:23S rRNA (adenine2503-C2)-methyltransferase